MASRRLGRHEPGADPKVLIVRTPALASRRHPFVAPRRLGCHEPGADPKVLIVRSPALAHRRTSQAPAANHTRYPTNRNHQWVPASGLTMELIVG